MHNSDSCSKTKKKTKTETKANTKEKEDMELSIRPSPIAMKESFEFCPIKARRLNAICPFAWDALLSLAKETSLRGGQISRVVIWNQSDEPLCTLVSGGASIFKFLTLKSQIASFWLFVTAPTSFRQKASHSVVVKTTVVIDSLCSTKLKNDIGLKGRTATGYKAECTSARHCALSINSYCHNNKFSLCSAEDRRL